MPARRPRIDCQLISPPERSPDNRFVEVDREVARRAGDEKGILSIGELRDCGLSHAQVLQRAGRGHLHRMHAGIYAVGHRGITLHARFLAAVKACGPGAVLSHLAAAVLWTIREWDDRLIEVTIADTTPREHEGLLVHRTRCLDRRDWRILDGIPVTTPERTALDCAAGVGFHEARRIVREALGKRLVWLPQLLGIIDRSPGRPGVGVLRRIVAEGPEPTRTALEDVVLDLILAGGFKRPDVNRAIYINGRRLVPDFRWPDQRLIVEADGGQWHDHKLAREDDAERQALLEASGEQVLRITWDQATTRRGQCWQRLRSAGAPPGTIVT